MKKITFGILLLALTVAGYSQETGRSNAIKLNPLSLVFATGNVAYERAIGSSSSIQLGAFYSGFKLSGLKYSGFGVTPEFRYYFGGAKEALNGVYVGPFVRYQKFDLEETDANNKTTLSTIGGGATIGWEKTWNSGFVLDIFAGPAYNNAKFKNDADEEEFDVSGGVSGFGVRTGITIGFAF
jgi:hypothetical protein